MSKSVDAPSAGRVASLYAEYVRTLKAIETEEAVDLVVYRPLGFVIAKLLQRSSLTPNHVSVASLCFGIAAGVLFWQGSAGAFAAAAAAYFACNALDCADGQLARLRGGSTPFGYVVDGAIDYAASVTVFVGIAHGLGTRVPGSFDPWILSGAAGLCYAWQCALLDAERFVWTSRVHGRRMDHDGMLRYFREYAATAAHDGNKRVERALISGYLVYHSVWSRILPPRPELPAMSTAHTATWAGAHRPVLRMATWMGPSTQMTLIMVAALAGHPEVFLWVTLSVGNALAVITLVAKRRADGLAARGAA